MEHRVLLSIDPNTFAFAVVTGMSLAGLTLGLMMDKAMTWLMDGGRR